MTDFRLDVLGQAVWCRAPAPVAERLVELLPGADRVACAGTPEVRVAAIDAGWAVSGEGLAGRTVPDPHEAATLAEWYLTQARLRAVRSCLQLHASACVSGARAVVAAGPSGRGKSALAVAWSVAGTPLLADDALIVTSDTRLAGLRRTVKLATAVARRLGVPVEDTVGWSAGSPDVWFDPGTAGGWADPAAPRRVAFVRWADGHATTLRAIPRAEAVGRLLATRLVSGASGSDAFAQAAALLAGVETLEATFGDAADAARRLADG